MAARTIFYIFFIYFLVLIQVGFLAHFSIFGFFPNFVLIFVFLVNILESPRDKAGIAAGIVGGIFLDIFSLSNVLFFGFYTLISLILAMFVKFILLRHVQLPGAKRT